MSPGPFIGAFPLPAGEGRAESQAASLVVPRNSFKAAGSGPDMPSGNRKSRPNRRLSVSRNSHFVAEPGYFVANRGVPGRIRTRDPLLRRQPLCPLSYWDITNLVPPTRGGTHSSY